VKGRNCLVTGASAGVGLATARALSRMGANVLLAARDPLRGRAALDLVRDESGGGAASLFLADFSSMAEVRRLATEVLATGAPLHVLVNNAAVVTRRRETTVDGLERQFAVNHLAIFLLTRLLLPRLEESAPSRVVVVASGAHRGGRVDFDDLQSERGRYRPMLVYAATKLENLLFTFELSRRLGRTRVTANAVHPGSVATGLLLDFLGLPRSLGFATRLVALTPEKGARTPVYLASSPEVEDVSGKYFVKDRAVEPSKAARDEDAARRLWKESARLAGVPEDTGHGAT